MPHNGRIRTSRIIQQRAIELRQEMTPVEKILWERLRDRRLQGLKFRRQAPIGPFIADFYCPACRQIIELDGNIHDIQPEQDLARTKQFESYGYHVIRFKNEDIEQRLEFVLSAILKSCMANMSSAPLLPVSGEGVGG